MFLFPKNLTLAKKYGVTATPVLVIADENEELLETYIGGLPITQNIRKVWDKYNFEKITQKHTKR